MPQTPTPQPVQTTRVPAPNTSATSFTGTQTDTPEPSSAEPIPRSQQGEVFGQYGTRIFSGFISNEEYNTDLSGHAGIKIYDQMRRSDGTVAAALKLVSYPIQAAEWTLENGSDEPEDVLIGEFVKYNLFERLRFKDLLREILLFLPFGFSAFEKLYSSAVWDGDSKGGGAGEYYCIDKLASRKQDTVFSWQLTNGQAGLQQITPSGGKAEIPANKLMIFTFQREGNNFEGISLLRPAYKHYYIKSQLEKAAAVAFERQGVGVPYFKPPANATDDEKKKARIAMQNLRANEQAYLEWPLQWEFGFLDMKAQTNADPIPQIQHHNRQILLTVLGQFLDMGSSGASGSRATSSDQSQLQEQSLEAIATLIVDVINHNLIKQLVDLNFNTTRYPKLKHARISDENVTQIADALQKLAAGGFITPDPELEETLRDIMHLPDLPDDIAKDYSNREKPVSQLPAPGQPPLQPSGVQPGAAAQPTEQPKAEAQPGGEPVAAGDLLLNAVKAREALIHEADKLYAEQRQA